MIHKPIIFALFIIFFLASPLLAEENEMYNFALSSYIKEYPQFKRGFDPWADLSGTVQENVDLYTGKLNLTFQLPGIPFSESRAFSPTLMYNSNVWGYDVPFSQTSIYGGDIFLSDYSGGDEPEDGETPWKPVVNTKLPNFFDHDLWMRFSPVGQPHNMPGWSLPIGGVYTEYTETAIPISMFIDSLQCESVNDVPQTVVEKKYFVSPNGSRHLLVDMSTNCRPFYGRAQCLGDGPNEKHFFTCTMDGEEKCYCLPRAIIEEYRKIWRSVDGSFCYYVEGEDNGVPWKKVWTRDGTCYELHVGGEYDGMIKKITDIDGNWIRITVVDDEVDGCDCRLFKYTGSTGAWMTIIFEKKYLQNYKKIDGFGEVLLLKKIQYPSVGGGGVSGANNYEIKYENLITHLTEADNILTYGDIFSDTDFDCPLPPEPGNPNPGVWEFHLWDRVFCNDEEEPTNEINRQVFVLTEIQLPDGRAFQFQYNHAGKISHVRYPDGGYRQYEYGNTRDRNVEDNNTCQPFPYWSGKIAGESPFGGVGRVLHKEGDQADKELERLYLYSGHYNITDEIDGVDEEMQETICWMADGSIQRYRYIPTVANLAPHSTAEITDYGLPEWFSGKLKRKYSYDTPLFQPYLSGNQLRNKFLMIDDDLNFVPMFLLSYEETRDFILRQEEGQTPVKCLREEETWYENHDTTGGWSWDVPVEMYEEDCDIDDRDPADFYDYVLLPPYYYNFPTDWDGG